MRPQERPYLSYLLRLWASQTDAGLVWRASLENPHTGERLGFGTLGRLLAFLQDQCAAQGEHADPPGTSDLSALADH